MSHRLEIMLKIGIFNSPCYASIMISYKKVIQGHSLLKEDRILKRNTFFTYMYIFIYSAHIHLKVKYLIS